MKTMTYTESRANYAQVLDMAVEDLEEVVITRAGREPAVILSLTEYESLKETAHLLRSPANARKLLNEGIGKPEALRNNLSGYWSRRITEEHRLIYKIVGNSVGLAAVRYHYE